MDQTVQLSCPPARHHRQKSPGTDDVLSLGAKARLFWQAAGATTTDGSNRWLQVSPGADAGPMVLSTGQGLGNDGCEFTYIGLDGVEAGVLGGCANGDGQGVASGHNAGGVGGYLGIRCLGCLSGMDWPDVEFGVYCA